MGDERGLATAILSVLFPGRGAAPMGLQEAIRLELLVTALQDVRAPRCVSDLLGVLERLAAGEDAEALLAALRERARARPGMTLVELARTAT